MRQIIIIIITLEPIEEFYHKIKRPRVPYLRQRVERIDYIDFIPIFIDFRVIQQFTDPIDQRLDCRSTDLQKRSRRDFAQIVRIGLDRIDQCRNCNRAANLAKQIRRDDAAIRFYNI